jgi:hypothetical protein
MKTVETTAGGKMRNPLRTAAKKAVERAEKRLSGEKTVAKSGYRMYMNSRKNQLDAEDRKNLIQIVASEWSDMGTAEKMKWDRKAGVDVAKKYGPKCKEEEGEEED